MRGERRVLPVVTSEMVDTGVTALECVRGRGTRKMPLSERSGLCAVCGLEPIARCEPCSQFGLIGSVQTRRGTEYLLTGALRCGSSEDSSICPERRDTQSELRQSQAAKRPGDERRAPKTEVQVTDEMVKAGNAAFCRVLPQWEDSDAEDASPSMVVRAILEAVLAAADKGSSPDGAIRHLWLGDQLWSHSTDEGEEWLLIRLAPPQGTRTAGNLPLDKPARLLAGADFSIAFTSPP